MPSATITNSEGLRLVFWGAARKWNGRPIARGDGITAAMWNTLSRHRRKVLLDGGTVRYLSAAELEKFRAFRRHVAAAAAEKEAARQAAEQEAASNEAAS